MLHYHVKLAKKKQQLRPLERHDVSREGLVVDVFAPQKVATRLLLLLL